MAPRTELVVVTGPSGQRAAVAGALARAGRTQGREVRIHRFRPPRPSSRRRGMATSVLIAAVHLARLRAAWNLRWRREARRRLVIVEGSYYDVLLRTDELGLAKQLIRCATVLAAMAPRADLVLVVDDADAARTRPLPSAPDWEPWTWGQLAPWIGARVRTVRSGATSDDLAPLLRDAAFTESPLPRWGRALVRGRRRDVRVTAGPHAADALDLFWGQRAANRSVLATNRALARHGALAPVVPPIDDLGDLCRLLELEAESIATATSRVAGRRMLGIVAGGRLAAVVKVGPADDRGLQREARMLVQLRTAAPPLRVPRLRWAGEWNDRFVVATDAVANRGAPRHADLDAIVDLCVAMATGGPWGRAVVHGDLAPWNLLVTDSGLVLVDWENAELELRPMHDLTHLLLTRAAASRHRQPARLVAELVGAGGAGQTYLTRVGLDTALAPAFARQYFEHLDVGSSDIGVPPRFARAVRARL